MEKKEKKEETKKILKMPMKHGCEPKFETWAECSRNSNMFSFKYYKIFDKDRESIGEFYHNLAISVYNGVENTGQDNICKMFSDLPRTEHQLKRIIADPTIEGTTDDEHYNYNIQVRGIVTYEGEEPRWYDHAFLVGKKPHTMVMVILKDNFKFIEKKNMPNI